MEDTQERIDLCLKLLDGISTESIKAFFEMRGDKHRIFFLDVFGKKNSFSMRFSGGEKSGKETVSTEEKR